MLTSKSPFRSAILGSLFLLATWSVPASVQSDEAAPKPFGFTGPEIFPIDEGITQLSAGDLDGDGKRDLVVVNNARSKISLLYNQTGETNKEPAKRLFNPEINELPPDARFRLDAIASEKRISSLVLTDLNGDDRPDLAYYGEPKELVVQYNEKEKGWSSPRRWPIGDGLLNPNSLVDGDLNGDGRSDLILLAENHFYVITQSEENILQEPQKVPYSGSVQALQLLDVQGDDRDDVLLVSWDNPHPFRLRLQEASGQLGPELHFKLPAIRSYWATTLGDDEQTEVITIAQKSGRAQVSHFEQIEAEPLIADWKQGQFHVLPLNRTTKAKRGVIWTDINGDALPDLLVAEPDSGQLTFYPQKQDGALDAGQVYATLTGVSELAAADWDGDDRENIFLLSSDERQVGVTTYEENGGVGFPQILSLNGRPLAMAVGSLTEGAEPVLTVIVEDQDGRKRELVVRDGAGEMKRHALDEGFRSNPASLTLHDVDQDGRRDLIVLVPYEKVKILRQKENDGGLGNVEFEEIDLAPPGGIVEQPWISAADIDGDGKKELLLAQRNFLRAVTLKKQGGDSGPWTFNVKEQINGAGSDSRIIGATALQTNTDQPVVFLLDSERKVLTVTQREQAGVWRIVRNLPLAETAFSDVTATAIGQAEPNSIAFFGLNMLAWLMLEGNVWDITDLDGYETPIRDGFLTDVVTGDLNSDEQEDVIFLETARNYLDIVTFSPEGRLEPAVRWQVFEERTFRNQRRNMPEPREALVADVTEDGKNDLIIVVHDRILVYPQQ